MNAEEMWRASGIKGEYEAWSFGSDADLLAALTLSGKKTATASAYELYAMDNEPLPETHEYSVIVDSRDNAVCIIRTTNVYVTEFNKVTATHAAREGEGDLSLDYWRSVHREFFTSELLSYGIEFSEDMMVVCEEFEKVFPY